VEEIDVGGQDVRERERERRETRAEKFGVWLV